MIRVRTQYQKLGGLRYTSHLDLQKIWVRTLLRAKIPLCYTQGFHPTVKIAPCWPLALGWAGMAELIDLWFDYEATNAPAIDGLVDLINRNSPPGLVVTAMQTIPLYDPSLTTIIQTADYQLLFEPDVNRASILEKMQSLLARESIIRVRRNKEYDLKPLIKEYSVTESDVDATILLITMSACESAMGRPDEVAAAMGFDPVNVLFSRLGFDVRLA